ncbi:MAG: cobyric acid synthase [Desulfobacteraceae bacterium]|nr:cobyric acid synthase [Desulfobacteraceae bacterium]
MKQDKNIRHKNFKHKNIAFLGTGSDVGKSIIAAAFCRSLADKGVNVAPFKAQNMSNNSGITPEGLEMGRAQIVQAEASKIAPHVDMNPVLLKPTSEKGSQVVLNGQVYDNQSAMDYHKTKDFYFKKACEAFDRLKEKYECIILEGAGSCAEVNLMGSDIVNLRMAEYAKADVILIADIHRGGVFAQIVGTLECLPEKYRNMIKGFIINRFRGDPELFKDGIKWIENKTNKKVFGIMPWYSHFRIDAEDSVEIENTTRISDLDKNKPAIGVIKLPHISNFTDLHSLSEIENIQTAFIDSPKDLSIFKALIIPGSKNTRADMEWLEKQGLTKKIKAYADSGGHILGICGGYQILGKTIDDPEGFEGKPGKTKGLSLLDVDTTIVYPKVTTTTSFSWGKAQGNGYEIHMGTTKVNSGDFLFKIHSKNNKRTDDQDGCISDNGKILGTYIHGMFDSKEILLKWLKRLKIKVEDQKINSGGLNLEGSGKEKNYKLLKKHFEKHVDFDQIVFNYH